MKNKELKEYLNTFDDNTNISIILANPKGRKLYEYTDIFLITDMEIPVICIEVGKESNMDQEEIAACEQDEKNLEGQMDFYDYPGVMP